MASDEQEDVAITKVELDVERHILSLTVKLSDGSTANVFSRSRTKNDFEKFTYDCHVCGVPNLPGERCLQTHIAGRKHQTKLSQPLHDAHRFRLPLTRSTPQISMKIAPGEPVPPGFENEVKPVSELQCKLDKCKEQSLIGLEYILELTMSGTSGGSSNSISPKEPSYMCVLCDKRGDPRTIIIHIASYNHRLKYLEKHFPTVMGELTAFRYCKESKEVMPRVLQTICEAVEDSHGRLSPSVYENVIFIKNRMKIIQEIYSDKHLDEKMGSTFVHVIDRKQILESIEKIKSVVTTTGGVGGNMTNPQPIGGAQKRTISPNLAIGTEEPIPKKISSGKRESLDSISSLSDSSIAKSPTKKRERIVGTIDLRSESRSLSPPSVHTNLVPKFSRSTLSGKPAKDRQMLPTPKELAVQSSEIAHERYKWEKYRCLVDLAVPDLEKKLKEHEKNPEQHPLYPDEWKKFWNRRYKQLQAEKKDPSKHDFKPEWIIFWTKRMKELHEDEIEKKKLEIRKKLNLPENGTERTAELKQLYNLKVQEDAAKKLLAVPSANNKTSSINKNRGDRSSPHRRPHPSSSLTVAVATATATSSSLEYRSSDTRTRRRRNSRSRSRSLTGRRTRRLSRSPVRSKRSPQSSRNRSRSPIPSSTVATSSRSGRRVSRVSHSPLSDVSRSSIPSGSRRNVRQHSLSPFDDFDDRSAHSGSGSYHHHHRRLPSHERGIDPLIGLSRPGYPPDYYRHEQRTILDEWGRPIYYPPHKRPPPPGYYYPPGGRPNSSQPEKEKLLEDEDTEPLTVVSVLRLLTALEELLGSLGPKVVDLLARALSLEKVKANSSDDMLINEDTCVLFETIKEKLKGQLIAGVIEKQKLPAVKRAIKNVAKIIHEVTERAKKSAKEIADNDSSASIKKATDALDKAAIAQKIATALVLQGKTDVSSEQLEQLIQVYMNMQQKSLESNAPLTTATYLESVSQQKSDSVPPTAATTTRLSPAVTPSPVGLDQDLPNEATSALESLTDVDLQTLLQNFKDLSTEEQQHLIIYLKKLEGSQPQRVEKLRKFVNVDQLKSNNNNSTNKSNSEKSPTTSITKRNISGRHGRGGGDDGGGDNNVGNNDNHNVDDNDDDYGDEDKEDPPEKIMYPSKNLLTKSGNINSRQRGNSSSNDYEHDDDDNNDNDNNEFIRGGGGAGGSVGSNKDKRRNQNRRDGQSFVPLHTIDSDDEDDDDYSYDDVFRAASKNVKEKQLQEHMKIVHDSLSHDRHRDGAGVGNVGGRCSGGGGGGDSLQVDDAASDGGDSTSTQNLTMSLTDTQNLIANLMGSLQKNVKNANKQQLNDKIQTHISSSSTSLSGAAQSSSTTNHQLLDVNEMDLAPRIPHGMSEQDTIDPVDNSSSSATAVGIATNVPYYQQQQNNDYYNNGGGGNVVGYNQQQQNPYGYGGNNMQQGTFYQQQYGQQQQQMNQGLNPYAFQQQSGYGNVGYPMQGYGNNMPQQQQPQQHPQQMHQQGGNGGQMMNQQHQQQQKQPNRPQNMRQQQSRFNNNNNQYNNQFF